MYLYAKLVYFVNNKREINENSYLFYWLKKYFKLFKNKLLINIQSVSTYALPKSYGTYTHFLTKTTNHMYLNLMFKIEWQENVLYEKFF